MIDPYNSIAVAVFKKRAEIEETKRRVKFYGPPVFEERVCNYTDRVLARHQDLGLGYCRVCGPDEVWPCRDRRLLADLWLGEGWEDKDDQRT